MYAFVCILRCATVLELSLSCHDKIRYAVDYNVHFYAIF